MEEYMAGFEAAELDGETAGTELESELFEAGEQREMDAFFEGRAPEFLSPEQAEMDAAFERMDEDEETLGEYRIFCDTRPAGSRYKIFADS